MLDVAHGRERILKGRSAFNAASLVRSAGDLSQAFVRTATALERSGLESTPRIEALRRTTMDPTVLMVAWCNGESLPGDPTLRVARRIAALVGNAILSRAASDVTDDVDLGTWRWPECPCCGASPDLALATESRRLLVCWRCDTRWRTGHLGCLGCGADGPPALVRVPSPYLGYELAVCNACGRYLKERTGALSHDLLVERAVVAGLDAAAQQRGLRT